MLSCLNALCRADVTSAATKIHPPHNVYCLLIVLLVVRLGLPTSSSQCITGGIIGVGLCEGIAKGVNWKLFGKQFASWVSTLFVVGLGVAAVFAQGIYSPSKVDGGLVLKYENALANSTSSMLNQFNSSLLAFKPAADAGALRTLSTAQWEQLNNTIEDIASSNKAITTVKDNTAGDQQSVCEILPK
jgi:sodium-dependent phosphate transporter